MSDNGYVEGPLLTVAEAARYLGVARSVLYRLMEEGELTVLRAGRSTRIEKKSLDAFKEAGRLT